jgi:carboxyl-terminal processing protease
VQQAAMATKDEHVKISGEASDPERLLDVYMFVGSRKLYYKSNRDGADPKKASFELDAPLRPGVNLITVFARETPDTITRRTIIVRKDAPDGSILKTPKTDDPVNDGAGDDGDE